MLYYQIDRYKAAMQEALEVVSRMEGRLNDYAKKPGANKTAIQIQRHNLAKINEVLEITFEVMGQADQIVRDNTSLRLKIKRLEQSNVFQPDRSLDKETLRAQSLFYAATNNPELY